MPQAYTLYEFDLEKANSEPFAAPEDLIYKIKTYPDDFGISNLSPQVLRDLISNIESSEETAKNFSNKMCDRESCKIEACDDVCRKDLACILKNANTLEIINCRGYGFVDAKYGLDFLTSLTQNPWVSAS